MSTRVSSTSRRVPSEAAKSPPRCPFSRPAQRGRCAARSTVPAGAQSGRLCITRMNVSMHEAVTRGLAALPRPRWTRLVVAVTLKPPIHQRLVLKPVYPASRLPPQVPLPVHHVVLHHPPGTGTRLPQLWRLPPLVLGRLTSLHPRRPPHSCCCNAPIRSPAANLTLFVSLVLDQRSHRQAICLPRYHDDLPPSLWPSYPLNALLKLQYTSMTQRSIRASLQ
jgi:hypothetical protein